MAGQRAVCPRPLRKASHWGACLNPSITSPSEGGGASGLLPVCVQTPGQPKEALGTMLSNGFQGCPLSQPLTGTESRPLLGSRPTREPLGSSPSSATAVVLGGLGKPQPGRISSWKEPIPQALAARTSGNLLEPSSPTPWKDIWS